MNIKIVSILNPDNLNFILGMSHFIKTVEDIHETIVQTVPAISFGLAFCEASGPCLVRVTGNDPDLKELAAKNALSVGAGHSFIIFLKNGYPINILNAIKQVPEVCRIFCATANPTDVVVVESGGKCGILGVLDGFRAKTIEKEEDIKQRKDFLRKIGYKL